MRVLKTLVLALGIACAATAVSARDWADIKKSGTLIAASEGAYAPFNFFQGNKLTGYEIEVMDAVAKKLGLKIQWKALGFDALIGAVSQDRFDLAIASHGITEERAKSVDFTKPHYCSGGQIVVKAGGPLKAAELTGKVIGVQLATTYADAAKKVTGAKEVKTFPKDTDAQQALMAGRLDAWVTDRFVAKEAIEKAGKGKLNAGDMLFIEQVATVIKKGNTGLRDEINGALQALKADGTLKKISEKWFKEDVTCPNL
ncbi:MAG: ABC transporter substrate-binding protein [Burkholderiaceae bacterium]